MIAFFFVTIFLEKLTKNNYETKNNFNLAFYRWLHSRNL